MDVISTRYLLFILYLHHVRFMITFITKYFIKLIFSICIQKIIHRTISRQIFICKMAFSREYIIIYICMYYVWPLSRRDLWSKIIRMFSSYLINKLITEYIFSTNVSTANWSRGYSTASFVIISMNNNIPFIISLIFYSYTQFKRPA